MFQKWANFPRSLSGKNCYLMGVLSLKVTIALKSSEDINPGLPWRKYEQWSSIHTCEAIVRSSDHFHQKCNMFTPIFVEGSLDLNDDLNLLQRHTDTAENFGDKAT